MNKITVILVSILTLCGCNRQYNEKTIKAPPPRLISLAPSITECCYAIGAGDQLVGVSSFCNYPDKARELPKIGGYTDTNYETIVSLHPSLVLLLKEHEAARNRLKSLHIQYITLDTSTIEGIKEAIHIIGKKTGHTDESNALLLSIENTIRTIQNKSKKSSKKRTLISISRQLGTGKLSDVYIAGPDTLFDQLLQLAHGENVYTGSLPYPKISREGLQRMNPDVIIDLIPNLDQTEQETTFAAISDWNELNVNAVKTGNIYLLNNDYVCIPGPRFIDTLKDIAKALHP